MGSLGGNAPNGYRQHKASTLFLRVPVLDWPRVKVGEKTEFRTRPGEGSSLLRVNAPTPVVAYRPATQTQPIDGKIMVLLERRYEPLFNISTDPEAVRREGFETYDEFRRYWRKRRKGVYRPMEQVHVWRVRPWEGQHDLVRFGVTLLGRLYGEFIVPGINPLDR